MRGFALTMIDASLALTEGRGGEFRPGREPYLLQYEGCADEVALIYPWSRTGRPMLAKPDPAKGVGSDGLDEIAAEGRDAMAALPFWQLPDVRRRRIVAEVARQSLRSVGASGGELDTGRRANGERRCRARGHLGRDACTRRSSGQSQLASGKASRVPTGPWATRGELRIRRSSSGLSANGLAGEEWPAFRRLAAEMERISFGPPPVNAAKLLALIESGKVDLSHLTEGPPPEATSRLMRSSRLPGCSASTTRCWARLSATDTRASRRAAGASSSRRT